MKKGFVFSLDALFAVTIVLIVAAMVFLAVFHGLSGKFQGSEFIRLKVADYAVLGTYQKQNAQAYGLSDSPDFFANEVVVCDESYDFEGSFQMQNFCQEVKR